MISRGAPPPRFNPHDVSTWTVVVARDKQNGPLWWCMLQDVGFHPAHGYRVRRWRRGRRLVSDESVVRDRAKLDVQWTHPKAQP